jgi:hypothetical protein
MTLINIEPIIFDKLGNPNLNTYLIIRNWKRGSVDTHTIFSFSNNTSQIKDDKWWTKKITYQFFEVDMIVIINEMSKWKLIK